MQPTTVTHTLPLGPVTAHTFRGSAPGPTIAVVAGVHGDEATPIAAVGALRQALTVRAGTVILIPAANPAAILAGSRYAHDHVDLNRCFDLTEAISSDEVRAVGAHARALLGLVAAASAVLDLHETLDAPPPTPSAVGWVFAPNAASARLVPFLERLQPAPGSAAGTLAWEVAKGGSRWAAVVETSRTAQRALQIGAYRTAVESAAAAIGVDLEIRTSGWKWR